MTEKLTSFVDRWNLYWFPESLGINLAVCRIVVVTSCLLFFFPPLETQIQLIEYNDSFTHPPKFQVWCASIVGEEMWRSVECFTLLHWVVIVSGILTASGFLTRVSSGVFALGFLALVTHRWSYGASMEIGPIKPVDTLNCIFFMILPFGPSGKRLSIDSWLQKRFRRNADGSGASRLTRMGMWQLKLMGLVVALVYLNAGWSKLSKGGIEWLNGYTVRNMNFQRGIMLDLPCPVWISQHQFICIFLSFVIIGLDVFFITGLIWKRFLPFWLIAAASFHFSTFFIYLNHYHFLSWVVMYLVFIDFEKYFSSWGKEIGHP